MYGWKIDQDLLGGEATGVRAGMPVSDGAGESFELYDDDKTLVARGRIVGDYDGFEPLDDYAQAMWGCTGIKYAGRWL